MSNLGYFQLKAAPGIHTLSIAPGRSRQLYAVAPDGLSDLQPRANSLQAAPLAPVPADEGMPSSAAVAVGDFSGRVLRLRLRKRPGMERADVLASREDDDEEGGAGGGLWGRAKGWLGAGGAGDAGAATATALAPAGEDNSKIHIFSVASGHLYEACAGAQRHGSDAATDAFARFAPAQRFLKIMVLSVLRHTKTPAKFWFIKNYASPGCVAALVCVPLLNVHWPAHAPRLRAQFHRVPAGLCGGVRL
jgi:UDP-glucose:glycoprotein glucosyltransferase